tara:strand:+ start:111 stop:290 length:180 start_codon:yes stop_codon:yes gene_type:complete
MKYNWNKETLQHFKFESNYLSKKEVLKSVENFVNVDCEIQQNETEQDLITDLMKQIFNN